MSPCQDSPLLLLESLGESDGSCRANKAAEVATYALRPDDESIAESESDDSEIDSLLEQAQKERAASSLSASPHAKQQIKLITAVDRHLALDSFAESEGLGLAEVLDDLEELASQKRHLDITYFTDEVLGDECMSELLDYFREAKSDDMDAAMTEYGDIYKEEELRLARIVFRMNKIKE